MKTLKKAASLLLVLSMIFSMAVTCAVADGTNSGGSAAAGDAESAEPTEEAVAEEETEPAEETAEPAEEETEPAEETAKPAEETAETAEETESGSIAVLSAVPEEEKDDADPDIRPLADTEYTETVTDADRFKELCEDDTYSSVTIQLGSDITMASESQTVTSMGPSELIIDGQGYTLYSFSSTGTSKSFLFDIGEEDGCSLTFKNLTVNTVNNQSGQKFINFSGMDVELQKVKLYNLTGNSNSNDSGNRGIFSVTGTNSSETSLTFDQTTTEGCTNFLIYLSGRGITMTAQNNSVLATTAVSDKSGYVGLIYTGSGSSSNWSSINILNSTLSFTASASYSQCTYLSSYWNLTLDKGTKVISVPVGTTYAIYPTSSNTNIYLNECTFENTDGSDPIVYLGSSGYKVHTDGNCEGALFQIRAASTDNNVPILVSGPLQHDLKFEFYSGSISGMDPWIAMGENDYEPDADDAAHLIYTDATSPRTMGADGNGHAVLYRADIKDCTITMADADGYLDAIYPGAEHIPFYYANFELGAVEPGVTVVADKGGSTFSASSDYTVTYENNEMPEGATEGEYVIATATVVPRTKANDESVSSEGNLIGDPVPVEFALVMPEVIDISDPDNGYVIDIDYDISTGDYQVYVYHEENGTRTYLRESTDYTVDFSVDTELYTMTASVTGRNSYEGTLEKTINLPGRDLYVFDGVTSSSLLNTALSGQYQTIVIARGFSVSGAIEVSYQTTIVGNGYSVTGADITVTGTGDLTVKNLRLNRDLYVEGMGKAEVTDGSTLRGVYVYEDGEATIGDCTFGGCSYLWNYGTLTVGEDAYLSDVKVNKSDIRTSREQYMIYNDGVLNWAGRFDVNYANGIGLTERSDGSVIYNTESGTINMTGGEINGYLLNSDGTYSDERTTAFYGAVLNYGTMNMSGGTITGFSTNGTAVTNTNSDTNQGMFPGGAGVRNKGVFNMSGGVITGNTAEDYSGSNDDKYSGLGGGVYNDWDSVFNMSGGEISENTATLGGGVFNMGTSSSSGGATFTMTGGTICDNMLSGDELEVGSGGGDLFNNYSGGDISNVGSEICSVCGAETTISGGTVSGDDLIWAALTDEYGNEEKVQIQTGIALDTAYSLSTNGGNDTSADCSMTVTGDPDIQVGILLINNLLLLQEAAVTASHNDGNGQNIVDDYVLYDLFPEFNYSWLWLDGGLTTSLNVTTLDLNNYQIVWTNNSTASAYPSLPSERSLTVNSNRSIIAFYPEGMGANQTEGELLSVDGKNPRQMYYYENRVNLYRNEAYFGGRTTTPIEIDTLFDYEAWVLCDHSEIDDIEWMDEIPATCEQYGTEGHYECTFCGAMFKDLECTEPVTIDDLMLDPLDHKYSDGESAIQWDNGKAATCTEDGYEAGYTCELCGMFFEDDLETEDTSGERVIPATGHSWIVVPAVPATATTDGQTAYCECENCGKRITEPEVIPATGVEADKSALKVAIEEAQALLDTDNSPYSEESLKDLQAAVDTANEVAGKDDVSQAEVNHALADLLDAVMALENEESDAADATALEIAARSAEALLDEEDSPYESLEELTAAVAGAEALLEAVQQGEDVEQGDIDAAVETIVDAINDLQKTSLPDTSALESLIYTAEVMTEKMNSSDYTEKSWDALVDALENAKAVAEKPVSQEEVDEAADALMDAISGLEAATEESGIDTSALKALIEATEAIKETMDSSDYTEKSWNALEDALENAKAVAEKPASQDEADEAADALTSALAALDKLADKTALESVIAAANDLEQTDYTPFSWQNLENALKEATDTYETETTDQDKVNEVTDALMKAIIDLEKTEVPVDKTGLEAMIDQVTAQYPEDDESEYDPYSWEDLQDALADAKAVNEDADATQDDVYKALSDLLDAVMNLKKAAGDTGEDTPNTDGLQLVIDSAEVILQEEDSPYTETSLDALQKAVDVANDLLKSGDYNATQVSEAAAAIRDAINGLVVNTEASAGEKNALQSAIDAAKKLTDSSDYTEASREALKAAIAKANGILTSDSPTQQEVSDALQALTEAIDGLDPDTTASTEEKEDLNTVIDAAKKLVESNYTSDSWSAMQTALATAESAASDPNATKEEVSEAMMDLTLAISSLVPSGNTGTTGGQPDEVKDGFVQENGEWHYYENGTRFTGDDIKEDLKKAIDGTDGWYYIVSGKVDFSYTGVSHFANAYGWWYISKGKVDFSCNSVEQNQYGWWYVVGGKVDFSYTGVSNYSNAYGWWYISKGKVDFGKTSIEPNNYGWWRVVDGKVDFSCNSVEQNDYGWWYVVGGKVDFSYTGVSNYSNAYGWWYISKGKVDFSCNSVEENQYGWWYVTGGKVDFSYTGVSNYANTYGWWYIKEGKVDFSYTGRASNNYGTWNVVNGKVVF